MLMNLTAEKQEEDQKKWWETLCKLQKLLRDATTYLHRVSSKETRVNRICQKAKKMDLT